MGYQFKLERIRHIREHERRIAQWNYAAAVGRLHQVEKELAEVQHEQLEVKHAMYPTEDEALSIGEIQDHLNYLIHLQHVASMKERERQRCQQQVVVEQQTLQSRRIEERVMEVLKERDYEAYRLEQNRQEQATLDEVAVTRHGRMLTGGR